MTLDKIIDDMILYADLSYEDDEDLVKMINYYVMEV